MAKKYALIGVGGFIAPRHLKAIKETGGELIASLDPKDSVGILDSYFPNCEFFTEFERFDRYLSMTKIDYLVVCSPNYLHDAHIRFGLRLGADVICEKPIVIHPHNIDALKKIEKQSGHRVYSVLQLRLHKAIEELRPRINGNHWVEIEYITPRGKWYDYSWKGDINKSGGLAMNIGVHLFDLLIHLFGKVNNVAVIENSAHRVIGGLKLEKADVEFTLSIKGEKKRLMYIDGKPVDFTEGFDNLHTEVYKDILNGGGFGLDECRPSIELVEKINDTKKR